MSILLGEAAHCEHSGCYGYESNHTMGNDTGDELRTIEYYSCVGYNPNTPWMYVFRSHDDNVARAMCIRMKQAVANLNIGYGQPTRETGARLLLQDPDPSHISVKCDVDCSSLVNTIAKISWEQIGCKINLTGFERTAEMPHIYRTMPQYFIDVTSQVDIPTGVGLKEGDILVRPSNMGSGHTAMVVLVPANFSVSQNIFARFFRKIKNIFLRIKYLIRG